MNPLPIAVDHGTIPVSIIVATTLVAAVAAIVSIAPASHVAVVATVVLTARVAHAAANVLITIVRVSSIVATVMDLLVVASLLLPKQTIRHIADWIRASASPVGLRF